MQHTGEEVKRAKINGVYSMVFRVYFAKTEIKISKSVVTVTPCETTLSVCVWVRVCVWNCVMGLLSPLPTKICHSTLYSTKKKRSLFIFSLSDSKNNPGKTGVYLTKIH